MPKRIVILVLVTCAACRSVDLGVPLPAIGEEYAYIHGGKGTESMAKGRVTAVRGHTVTLVFGPTEPHGVARWTTYQVDWRAVTVTTRYSEVDPDAR